MNCETYIVTSQAGKLSFFPDNFDTAPLRESLKQGNVQDNELAVLRRGDMVYYVYLRRLLDSPNEFVGVAVGLNSIVVTDVAALHQFFQKIMRSMAAQYNVATYKKEAGTYCTCKYTPYPEAAVERLRTAFNSRFADSGIALGPRHFSGTPGTDNLRVQADRKVVRFFTNENKYAQFTISQTVEQGNLVVISSDITDEQEIARLNAQIAAQKEIIVDLRNQNENYQSANQVLTCKVETLQNQLRETQGQTKPAKEKAGSKSSWIGSFFHCLLVACGIPLTAFYYPIAHRVYFIWLELGFTVLTVSALLALVLGIFCGWQKLYHPVIFAAWIIAYVFGCLFLLAFLCVPFGGDIIVSVYEKSMMLLAFALSVIGIIIGHKLHVRR